MELSHAPITLEREPGDDPEFLAAAQRTLSHFLHAHAPDDVFIIRIDSWFNQDHLPSMRPDGETRLPPFRAEHVYSELRYEKDETGAYPSRVLERPIHPSRDAVGAARTAEAWAESALFFWYSSGSTTNRRGSIMLLELREEVRGLACIQLGKNGAWRVSRVDGLEREAAEAACGLSAAHE